MIYHTLFEYGIYVFWGTVSLLILMLTFSVSAFSVVKESNFDDIVRIKEQNIETKKVYELNVAQQSWIELISLWGMVKTENSWFVSQDNLLSVDGKFVLPRIAGGETKKITDFIQNLSGETYQNSDFSNFFQEILVKPLSFLSPRTMDFKRYSLTQDIATYFGLGCLNTRSEGSFVCQSAVKNFLENFFVVESSYGLAPSDPYYIQNPTEEAWENTLLSTLIQIYPKIRYSHEKKKLFCQGVIQYLNYGGVMNTSLTDMMGSCDGEVFKSYTFAKDFNEIKDGFLWGVSDGKIFNDTRLNQYKLFSLQQLLYKQIKSSAQIESLLSSYLDFWVNLLSKENERGTQLLDSFSKQFSHWYHQNLLLPYLRDENAKVSSEQKNQLLTKLLQIENGDKNGLFKGIGKSENIIADKPQEQSLQQVDIEQIFRANLPVQFILSSSKMSGEVLVVKGEDQLTNLKLQANLNFDGANLYVTKIAIEKNKNLTDYVNTLLSMDKYSFLKMLALIKDNQEIAKWSQNFEFNLCASLQKDFGDAVKKCSSSELLMIKNAGVNSGVEYRFDLKDSVLTALKISDQSLQEQVLSELDFKSANRDTTLGLIQRIWNYQLKRQDSGFGAKEQILVNDAFVKYFKQKPKKVDVVGSSIRIYFRVKDIDFIGQYDLATNRLSQISLDFGEIRRPVIVQRLIFDLDEKSRDIINAFLLDPIVYLKKLNPRLVEVYFKDGKLTAPVKETQEKSE